jgi:hypothetical protein
MVKIRASRLVFKSATVADVQNALTNQPAHYRIRAIASKQNHTLIVRARLQRIEHPSDRPDLQPSLANITLPAITCGEERQILVRKPHA